MAQTLLNCVNEVLKRTGIIAGDINALTTLTSSAIQHEIDVAIQVWNEAIDELYITSSIPMPTVLGEDTISLVTNTRNYTLNSSLNVLLFPLVDETNSRYISEYPGGYMQLIMDQPKQSSFTGTPLSACIRPTDGALYLNSTPSSTENGLVYKYRYEKDLSMSLATDTVPFKDVVFRAMVPAVSEIWKRDMKKTFDQAMFDAGLGRASRYLLEKVQRTNWAPYKIHANPTDPYVQ
jgi:hypothetical protein